MKLVDGKWFDDRQPIMRPVTQIEPCDSILITSLDPESGMLCHREHMVIARHAGDDVIQFEVSDRRDRVEFDKYEWAYRLEFPGQES